MSAVANDSVLSVVWKRHDGTHERIQASTSLDGGTTWRTPATLSASGQDAYGPKVVTDGMNITALWSRATGADVQIQAATSSNGGATWGVPITLPTGTGNAVEPTAVTVGSTVTAVWRQWDGSHYRIRTSSSLDGGRTWSQPVTVSAAGGEAYQPRVFAIGSDVFATWSRQDGAWDRLQTASLRQLGITRLAGADRYATALEISSRFNPGVPVVYLATGASFPDALSAASAAAAQGGPLLLTPSTALPSTVRNELRRLDPALVVIAGGPSAVSPAVETAVVALLPNAEVRRDEGGDRYATSRKIAQMAFPDGATSAYIATGANFPDALSASAAAGAAGVPVILVNGTASGTSGATQELLIGLGVERVIIAGGPAVISASVKNSLDALLGAHNVRRLSGADRFATSVAINDAAFSEADTVFIASGLGFADALAGSALAGGEIAPLFVVPRTCVPAAVLTEIGQLGATKVVLLGGTSVLTTSVAGLSRC